MLLSKDELFGCNFKEYLKNLKIDEETFLNIKKEEIKMIERQHKKLSKLYHQDKYDEDKIIEIRKFLEKKRKNLKNYEIWAKNT